MFQSAIVNIEVPYQLMLPSNPLLDDQGQPGPPNEFYGFVTFLNDHCPNWIDGIQQRTYRGTWDTITYHYKAEIALSMMTLPILEMFRAVGGEVKSLPMWALVDPAASPPGTEETWQEFIDNSPNYTFLEIGEDKYVATTVLNPEGDYLPYTQAVEAFGIENLRTQPQIQELMANAPVVEPDPEGDEPADEHDDSDGLPDGDD
jgi:hypothetical protein